MNDFLDPGSLGYQIERALRAVAEGGLFGRGPGEGVQKWHLPDAHADFIFAATAEEFGVVACLALVALFAFLILRGLWRVSETSDRFVQLAAAGLIAEFGLQALINMAVNLNLIPTKGMTLPFISYGGSSLLALAIAMGMLLALTRRGARLQLPRTAGVARVTGPILIAAGGTGGHMFPALALGRALAGRGLRRWRCSPTAAARAMSARELPFTIVSAGSPSGGARRTAARAWRSWRAACCRACGRCAAPGRQRPPRSAATPRCRRRWPRPPTACRCWSTSRTPCSAAPTG